MTIQSCADQQTLVAFADGQLESTQSQALQAHIRVCSVCAQALRSVEQTLLLTKESPVPELSLFQAESFAQRVRLGIRERYHRQPVWWQRPWTSLLAGAAGGAVCAAIALGALTGEVTAAAGHPPEVAREMVDAEARTDGAAPPSASATQEGEVWADAIDMYLIETATESELLANLEAVAYDDELMTALLDE
ncbi:hypothetical protein ACFL6X_00555 [Candidatus Latescibacterota bacterium]